MIIIGVISLSKIKFLAINFSFCYMEISSYDFQYAIDIKLRYQKTAPN